MAKCSWNDLHCYSVPTHLPNRTSLQFTCIWTIKNVLAVINTTKGLVQKQHKTAIYDRPNKILEILLLPIPLTVPVDLCCKFWIR